MLTSICSPNFAPTAGTSMRYGPCPHVVPTAWKFLMLRTSYGFAGFIASMRRRSGSSAGELLRLDEPPHPITRTTARTHFMSPIIADGEPAADARVLVD